MFAHVCRKVLTHSQVALLRFSLCSDCITQFQLFTKAMTAPPSSSCSAPIHAKEKMQTWLSTRHYHSSLPGNETMSKKTIWPITLPVATFILEQKEAAMKQFKPFYSRQSTQYPVSRPSPVVISLPKSIHLIIHPRQSVVTQHLCLPLQQNVTGHSHVSNCVSSPFLLSFWSFMPVAPAYGWMQSASWRADY